MTEEIKNEDVKLAPTKVGDIEETKDTVSKLFDDRDRDGRDRADRDQPKVGESRERKTPATQKAEEVPELKATNTQESKPTEKKSDLKEDDGNDQPHEVDILRKKLEKVEKTLAENHKYGRSNAQKVKNALKVVQKFTDDGLLAEEEAKELLGTHHSDEEGTEDEEVSRYQNSPFAPIIKVANKEMQNILKYTDDDN